MAGGMIVILAWNIREITTMPVRLVTKKMLTMRRREVDPKYE